MWKNITCSNSCKNTWSSICNSRCNNINRSRICWRRCWKHLTKTNSSSRLWCRKSTKRNYIHRWNRQNIKKIRKSIYYKGCKWRRCTTSIIKNSRRNSCISSTARRKKTSTSRLYSNKYSKHIIHMWRSIWWAWKNNKRKSRKKDNRFWSNNHYSKRAR